MLLHKCAVMVSNSFVLLLTLLKKLIMTMTIAQMMMIVHSLFAELLSAELKVMTLLSQAAVETKVMMKVILDSLWAWLILLVTKLISR